MAAAPTDDGIDALHLSETHATAGGGLPLDAQQAEAIIADLATPPEQTYSVEPVRVRSPPPSRRRSLPTAAQSGVAKLRDPAYGDGSPTKVMGESGPGSAKEGAMANHGSYNGDDTASPVSKDGNVAIVVGGRRFIVDPKIFASEPDSFLGRMFGSISTGNDQPIITPNRNGDYIVGHTGGFSAQCFRAVLDYYKRGEICCPPNVSVTELKEACDFFLVPFSHKSVKCNSIGALLHQLSNKGAEAQFNVFLEETLTPAMALSASLGERESHIVVLRTEDTVDWDDDFPPRLGEQYAQVVHSTALVRYMKYHENRQIANMVLKRRGMKSIKIGVEGFPTFAEKIRRAADGTKCEVVYNYEQRPFIKLSWEQEDSKSRHVNFQTVRGRRQTTQPHN